MTRPLESFRTAELITLGAEISTLRAAQDVLAGACPSGRGSAEEARLAQSLLAVEIERRTALRSAILRMNTNPKNEAAADDSWESEEDPVGQDEPDTFTEAKTEAADTFRNEF